MNLFLRCMTKGVLSERDRLLNYSVGEYFQEVSLFIEEQSLIKKEQDKLNSSFNHG